MLLLSEAKHLKHIAALFFVSSSHNQIKIVLHFSESAIDCLNLPILVICAILSIQLSNKPAGAKENLQFASKICLENDFRAS